VAEVEVVEAAEAVAARVEVAAEAVEVAVEPRRRS
jgi:hypothetical protein